MRNRSLIVAVLLASAAALRGEETPYQIELVPTGSVISTDAPASRGNIYLFHRYPSGTFVSLRRAEVRQIHRISVRAAADTNPAQKIIRIQTVSSPGSSQAGPTSMSAWRPAAKKSSRSTQ